MLTIDNSALSICITAFSVEDQEWCSCHQSGLCSLQEQRVWQEKEASTNAAKGPKKGENGKEPSLENGAAKGDNKENAKDSKAPSKKAPDSNGI